MGCDPFIIETTTKTNSSTGIVMFEEGEQVVVTYMVASVYNVSLSLALSQAGSLHSALVHFMQNPCPGVAGFAQLRLSTHTRNNGPESRHVKD